MSCDEGCGCDHEDEIEVEAEGIEVSEQPIELYKVLKIANVVEGGGQAKMLIGEGYVYVNGEVELRKRRKCYDGDVVYFNEEYFVVLCDQPVKEAEPKPAKPAKPKASQSRKKQNKPVNKRANSLSNTSTSTGRKSIKF
ncbi:RNA-binding S4 domain-containing protein [Catenovulum sp. SM1970]|uniref:RNA-binding S4 domain-containing protein n=1 Tax=Marinifaba aquimaris TaxID=2741323 RepID=UPI0015720F86|nr:RNA-binding S4 domain-containing protein [Marinifaba aquimaris]NTS76340.1 RNA-binding S4 domain-containing protein [Marinifaba aquimaris]